MYGSEFVFLAWPSIDTTAFKFPRFASFLNLNKLYLRINLLVFHVLNPTKFKPFLTFCMVDLDRVKFRASFMNLIIKALFSRQESRLIPIWKMAQINIK